MAILSSLPGVTFFWLAFAINFLLLYLQLFYVSESKRPNTATLAYRFAVLFGFSGAFTYCLVSLLGLVVGRYLQSRSSSRRDKILSWVRSNARNGYLEDLEDGSQRLKQSSKPAQGNAWNGIVGFFHPFCNAGGGGERVLWAAIKSTQEAYPNSICVVYTGDHDASKTVILESVKTRFNIELDSTRLFFLYLSYRRFVLASTWPHFTLLGQSLGSLILAVDAFSLLVPDVFIDTMGYAYGLALTKCFFPDVPIGAYVHYPTISTDMLGSLDSEGEQGVNAGSGKGLKGSFKKQYWRLFAASYGWVGGHVDVVMTNSSWTQAHIQTLWGASRTRREKTSEIEVLYPPVAVDELEKAIAVTSEGESKRENILLYIAQFRPEKNHAMILRAFAKMLHNEANTSDIVKTARLILIGSVRDSGDEKKVYELRLLAHELKIKEQVEFVCDASWPDILTWLGKSSVGVNGMWNEHFGIGVVEYQAAGLISVVNNSGGPKEDIVVDYDDEPTGFHASTPAEYSEAFVKALTLSPEDKVSMRLRARASAQRFGEQEFSDDWIEQLKKLIQLRSQPPQAEFFDWSIYGIGAAYLSFICYEIWGTLQ